MRRPVLFVLVGALCLASLSGCLTRSYPEKRRYLLEPTREGLPPVGAPRGTLALSGAALRVERIRVDPLFERKGFVYRKGKERFESDFYNEFFAPPGVVIRKAVATWLAESPLFEAVLEPGAPGDADLVLEGQVTLLYADLRSPRAPRAVLEIQFTLLDVEPSYEVVFEKRYSVTSESERASAPAIARAWSKGLSEILSALEADLGRQLAS